MIYIGFITFYSISVLLRYFTVFHCILRPPGCFLVPPDVFLGPATFFLGRAANQKYRFPENLPGFLEHTPKPQ